MESVKFIFKNNIRQYGMLIALVVIMAFFQMTTNGILLVPMNVTNLVLQNAYVFILAIGMVLTIMAGGNIDLSVGSLVAFVGAISGSVDRQRATCQCGPGHRARRCLVVPVVGIWQGYWIALCQDSGVHRHAGGHAHLPRPDDLHAPGADAGALPGSFQAISSGFVPDFLAVPRWWR